MKNTRTKIIATIGPKCSDLKTITELVEKGVNCFRINLSHGDRQNKLFYFELIKSIKTNDKISPTILADLSGPKIRVSDLESTIRLSNGENITVSSEKRGSNIISVSENTIFKRVLPGAKILIDDGGVSLEVIDQVSDKTLNCKTVTGGKIKNRKGVNFPGISLDVPSLTEQDLEDLKLSLENGADWIALSFAREANDYENLKSKISDLGYSVLLMAKIEKWEAVENLESIIKTFDAVMVARGDLGVELPIEKVPLIQKEVIQKSRYLGKPVVIATQILDSMIERPVPTRAEVSDIANAILDGADALLVTGETAIGAFPKKVIKVLKKVISETESSINYERYKTHQNQQFSGTAQAISHAACSVAYDLNIDSIITMTHTGSTARKISCYRPDGMIIAMTPFKEIYRQLSIVWGVRPLLVPEYKKADDIPSLVSLELKTKGLVSTGQSFIITGGVPVGLPGTTNYLTVLKME